MTLPLVAIGERDPFMRRTLGEVLRPHYKVLFADDGDSLIQLVKEHHPQIVILEILLPGKDGIQTCRYLKEDPETAHIPVLFFTYLNAEARARQAGAEAFLLKPVETDLLLNTLASLHSLSGEES